MLNKGFKKGPRNFELKKTKPNNNEQILNDIENQIKACQFGSDEKVSEIQKIKMKKFSDSKTAIGMLKEEDFVKLEDIGNGIGGVVEKIRHIKTKLLLARKLIQVEMNREKRTSIIREYNILEKCNSPYIVGYYGSYLSGSNLAICMEFMSAGSLNFILEKVIRIPEDIIATINVSILKGLVSLRSMGLIHRDVKPSNILLNDEGDVKLCDFGVSGVLINSMANSFVGTRSYMAPERLTGQVYNTNSDVWSLGLTLIELATGRYPYPKISDDDYDKIMSLQAIGSHSISDSVPSLTIFALLSQIVDNDPPSIPTKYFSEDFRDFTSWCMKKNPLERCNFDDLMKKSFFTKAADEDPRKIAIWIKEKDALL